MVSLDLRSAIADRRNVIAIILVLVSLLLLISGCGSDAGLAKQYIHEAEEIHEEARLLASSLNEKKRDLLQIAIAGDLDRLVAMEGEIQQIVSDISEATAGMSIAISSYKRVQRLKNVDEYKEYCALMVDAIEMEKEALALGRGLAKDLLIVITDLKRGKTYDLPALVTITSSTINLLDDYVMMNNDIEREARIYANDHDLFD